MQITIPDEILNTTQLSANDIKQEIALLFLRKHHISVIQAAHLAEISEQEMTSLLKAKNNNLKKLPKRDCIIGDPDELVHIDWSKEWRE